MMPLSSRSRTMFSPFFFKSYVVSRDLHSFPTRRSSDLAHLVLAVLQSFDDVLVDLIFDELGTDAEDRKSTRLNSSHVEISYAVFCLKKKNRVNARTGNRCFAQHFRFDAFQHFAINCFAF